MKKKLLFILFVFVSIGVFIAYKMYNKPHVNIEAVKSDVVISATDFFNAYSTDETSANKVYLDKIVTVNGIITDIQLENEKAIVSLLTNDDFGSILCHLSESATQKINDYKVLDPITLKGICTGFLMDVIVVKCELVN